MHLLHGFYRSKIRCVIGHSFGTDFVDSGASTELYVIPVNPIMELLEQDLTRKQEVHAPVMSKHNAHVLCGATRDLDIDFLGDFVEREAHGNDGKLASAVDDTHEAEQRQHHGVEGQQAELSGHVAQQELDQSPGEDVVPDAVPVRQTPQVHHRHEEPDRGRYDPVKTHRNEVPLVEVPDARTYKKTVVVTSKDARPTNVAVVSPGWLVPLALATEPPLQAVLVCLDVPGLGRLELLELLNLGLRRARLEPLLCVHGRSVSRVRKTVGVADGAQPVGLAHDEHVARQDLGRERETLHVNVGDIKRKIQGLKVCVCGWGGFVVIGCCCCCCCCCCFKRIHI